MRPGIAPQIDGRQDSGGRFAVQRVDPMGCVKLPYNPQQVHCLGLQTLPTQRDGF
jgi:hypothetical protein